MSLALIALLPQLIASGIATVEEVKSIVVSMHPGMTDPELNAILALIVTSATRHKALADADRVKPR